MIEIVDTRLLEDVADMKPSPSKDHSQGGFSPVHGAFDLGDWIASHEVPVRRESAWNGSGYRWVLEECPWNGHADNAPFIVRWPDGTIGAGCHHNSCQQYGWRDLREHYEPGCYDKRDVGAKAHSGHAPEDESDGGSSRSWVPRFPTEVLPPTLRRFVKEAAASVGCPPEFVAVPMLATLGAAIGNGIVLEAKGGYTESATLYTAIVGDPGTSKTPAFSLATAPARKKQEELAREYREAAAEYDRKSSEDELFGPAAEPNFGRSVVQDTTVEALAGRLAENPRGLLLGSDEISGWVRSMDQYKGNKGNDRQFYLSLWSSGSVTVDRKGKRDPLMIPRPFLSIAGGIQPGVLSEIKNSREDGLLDRFLFAYPEPTPSRWSENEVSEGASAAYRRIYEELHGLCMETDENDVPDPRCATFMPSAKEALVEEHNALSEEMERPGFPVYLKGPWSKMRAYLLRLSLIVGMASVAEFTSRRPGHFSDMMKSHPVIAEGHVKAAVALVGYFKAHARRVHARLRSNQQERLAEAKGNKANAKSGTDLASYLEQSLRDRGGRWQGMTSRLYETCQAASVSGLPGGVGPFGKLVRKLADDPDNDLVLDEGWLGKDPIIKLSLSTLGTVGQEEDMSTETTKGTKGRNVGEEATANHTDPDVQEGALLTEIAKALGKLLEDCPEHLDDPDPILIAMDLSFSDYLDYLPEEAQVEKALMKLHSP